MLEAEIKFWEISLKLQKKVILEYGCLLWILFFEINYYCPLSSMWNSNVFVIFLSYSTYLPPSKLKCWIRKDNDVILKFTIICTIEKIYHWKHTLNVVKVVNTYLTSVRGKKIQFVGSNNGRHTFFLFRQPLYSL